MVLQMDKVVDKMPVIARARCPGPQGHGLNGCRVESSESHPQSTPVSLFSRLRDPGDHAAWREFQHRYHEMLRRFCRKRGLQPADAEDVVQTVFINLSKALPGFTYDPRRGRFRDYLFRCVRNSISEWARRRDGRCVALDTSMGQSLASADDAGNGPDAAQWRKEWVAHHYRVALERLRGDFDARNVAIFERNVDGQSVPDLAREHGIDEQTIYAARRRIRARLQELIAEQVRDEDGQFGTPFA